MSSLLSFCFSSKSDSVDNVQNSHECSSSCEKECKVSGHVCTNDCTTDCDLASHQCTSYCETICKELKYGNKYDQGSQAYADETQADEAQASEKSDEYNKYADYHQCGDSCEKDCMIELCIRLTCPPPKPAPEEPKCDNCLCACHPKEIQVRPSSIFITESEIQLCKCYLKKQRELEQMRQNLIREAKRIRIEKMNACPEFCTCNCGQHQYPNDHARIHAACADTETPQKSATRLEALTEAGGNAEEVNIETVQDPVVEKIQSDHTLTGRLTSVLGFGKSAQ